MADGDLPIDTRYIAACSAKVLLAAVDDKREVAAELVIDVGERFGAVGVYALCCGLAEAVIVMGKFKRAAECWYGFYGFEVIEMATGHAVDPAAVGRESQPVISGQRFVTAHLNQDSDQALAVFYGDPVGVCAGLTVLAGAFGRHARAENSG